MVEFGDALYNDMTYAGTNNGQASTHYRLVSLDELNDIADIGAEQSVRRNPHQQLAARWDPFKDPNQPGAWEDTDDEELERNKMLERKDALSKKQIQPFVQKLKSFLDNERNAEIIRWSDDGNFFKVLDVDQLTRTLIPEHFKHNNYNSFVRQLNLYGFHKRVGLSDNSVRAKDAKAKAPSEYFHKYFKRGRPELLWRIQKPKNAHNDPKRKRDEDLKQDDSNNDRNYAPDGLGRGSFKDLAVRGNQGRAMIPTSEQNSLLLQVRALQQHQRVVSNFLIQMDKQNEQLYQQMTSVQTLQDRHENSLNEILTSLAALDNQSLESNNRGINFADLLGPAIAA